MAFKPNEFVSEISKAGGVALASDFRVLVTPPDGMKHLDNEALQFRIDGIDFPARSVTEINNPIYGAPYKIGATLNYVPISLSVIMSPDMRERDFFLEWQDLIGGSHRKSGKNSDEVNRQFNIGFYNEYVSGQGIEIQQFDRGAPETPVYTAKLMDCYPSLVGASTMSWQTPDVLRLSVTISYRYFTDEFTERNAVNNVSSDSLFTRLNKSGAGGLINMGVGRLAEKVGTKATAAAIFAAGKLMK